MGPHGVARGRCPRALGLTRRWLGARLRRLGGRWLAGALLGGFATRTEQTLGELGDVTQAPPIGHSFAPYERVGVDAASIERTDELAHVHGDRLPARDVYEPAHRTLN
jgi:hypothetical protein